MKALSINYKPFFKELKNIFTFETLYFFAKKQDNDVKTTSFSMSMLSKIKKIFKNLSFSSFFDLETSTFQETFPYLL